MRKRRNELWSNLGLATLLVVALLYALWQHVGTFRGFEELLRFFLGGS